MNGPLAFGDAGAFHRCLIDILIIEHRPWQAARPEGSNSVSFRAGNAYNGIGIPRVAATFCPACWRE